MGYRHKLCFINYDDISRASGLTIEQLKYRANKKGEFDPCDFSSVIDFVLGIRIGRIQSEMAELLEKAKAPK